MFAENSINPNKLFNIVYDAVSSFCQNNRVKHIPVSYGVFEKESTMEFNTVNPAVHISYDYPIYLKQFAPRERVFHYLEAIGHELKHYDQHIEFERRGIKTTRNMYSEKEAEQAAIKYAKDNIDKYTKEEINPINTVDSYITKGNAIIEGDPKYRGYYIIATGFMIPQCKRVLKRKAIRVFSRLSFELKRKMDKAAFAFESAKLRDEGLKRVLTKSVGHYIIKSKSGKWYFSKKEE